MELFPCFSLNLVGWNRPLVQNMEPLGKICWMRLLLSWHSCYWCLLQTLKAARGSQRGRLTMELVPELLAPPKVEFWRQLFFSNCQNNLQSKKKLINIPSSRKTTNELPFLTRTPKINPKTDSAVDISVFFFQCERLRNISKTRQCVPSGSLLSDCTAVRW